MAVGYEGELQLSQFEIMGTEYRCFHHDHDHDNYHICLGGCLDFSLDGQRTEVHRRSKLSLDPRQLKLFSVRQNSLVRNIWHRVIFAMDELWDVC